MTFLRTEREVLEELLPGLDGQLASLPLSQLEIPGSPGIAMARTCGTASLLVPRSQGGIGATAAEASRVLRAIGSRSPSVAVAMTMHSFSVATLAAFDMYGGNAKAVLSEVAKRQLLIASGFAEGRPGANLLEPTMQARPTTGGFLVTGSKKPCSLSRSMDVLSAGVLLEDGDVPCRALAHIPADSPGIERRPFWASNVLAGAESDEVILTDVFVPEAFLARPSQDANIEAVEVAGFCWFELLISSAYLGTASGLAERALRGGRGSASDRARLGIELEGAQSSLLGLARSMDEGTSSSTTLAQALLSRYFVQSAIERATALAAELAGGMAFISSADVAYLLGAARALAFHPPSRVQAAESLAAYLSGEPFRMP